MPQRGLPSCCNGPQYWPIRREDWYIYVHLASADSLAHPSSFSHVPFPIPRAACPSSHARGHLVFNPHRQLFASHASLNALASRPCPYPCWACYPWHFDVVAIRFRWACATLRCAALHCTDASLTLPCGLVILCHFWLLLSRCPPCYLRCRVRSRQLGWYDCPPSSPALSCPCLGWSVRPVLPSCPCPRITPSLAHCATQSSGLD